MGYEMYRARLNACHLEIQPEQRGLQDLSHCKSSSSCRRPHAGPGKPGFPMGPGPNKHLQYVNV